MKAGATCLPFLLLLFGCFSCSGFVEIEIRVSKRNSNFLLQFSCPHCDSYSPAYSRLDDSVCEYEPTFSSHSEFGPWVTSRSASPFMLFYPEHSLCSFQLLCIAARSYHLIDYDLRQQILFKLLESCFLCIS